METRCRHSYLLAVLMIGFLFACTKSEVRTRKILKHGRWMMSELLIGSNNVTLLPKWDLDEPSEDGAYASATWTHHDGSQAIFKWRFDPYVGSFSFVVDKSITQDELAKAYIQCDNLSGEYIVVTEKSKMFEFESTESKGYLGLTVFIQIVPL